MALPGVDVSSFQGLPAQWRPKAGNIAWAAVKITELETNGTRYVNPDAAADWAALKHGGKGRIGYLFGHPGTSAAGTVELFTTELGRLGLADRDGVALDLEVTDGRTPAQVAAWSENVLAALASKLDRTPLVYTFLSFAGAGNCAGLGKYPLWIADPSSPEGKPRVPGPWRAWAIHQYVTGGTIDRDLATWPTVAAMSDAIGKHKPGPILHVTAGQLSLAGLARKHPGCTPSAILRLTAEHSPGQQYPHNVSVYLNGIFSGDITVDKPMPAGLHLWLPAPAAS
jgi:Glycosyl hydrolases family 25